VLARRADAIDLRHPLSLANAWRFPLQSAESRREVLIRGF